MSDSDRPERPYRVVLNLEEQYSIWPAELTLPAGWRPEGSTGTKDACLERIGQAWTDMRPRSLREPGEG